MGVLRIGCSGFPVSREKYFKAFRTVEIQRTFYEPPSPALAEKWKAEAPEGFVYTMKAWQLITHRPGSPTYRKLKSQVPEEKEGRYGSFSPTEEVFGAWERTRGFAEALGARVIVFQCPPSFAPDEGNKRNVREFFSNIDRGAFMLAWEPRGAWETGVVEAICRDLGLIHVVDPFRKEKAPGGLSYYRLHGIGGYSYRYKAKDLETLRGIVEKDAEAYVMFNNTHMFEDALAFKEMMRL